MDKKITKELVYQLVINNDKLERLKSKTNIFNPFKILNLEDHEIRHSNMIAWIFNPDDNHNLDDKVLKKFLLKIILNPDNENTLTENINLYELQKKSYMDINVYREEDNIDLVLVSEFNKTVIFIENKVNSSEHSNQLNRYLKIIEQKYKGYKIIPIFLTVSGEEPSNKNYLIGSYYDLYEVLTSVLDLYKERTTEEIENFLNYYLNILKEKLFMDSEIKKLCSEIYRENKEIIDLIYSIGNDLNIENSIVEFNKSFPNVNKTFSNNKSYWFKIPEFEKAKEMNHTWGGGIPFSYWFSEYNGFLKIVLEVGPFDSSLKRVEFLGELIKNGVKISKKSLEPGRKYTRLYTATKPIKDWSDSREISEVMITLYNHSKMKDIEKKLIKSIDEFKWDY